MKVKELIEKLKDFDENRTVEIAYESITRDIGKVALFKGNVILIDWEYRDSKNYKEKRD